MASLGIFSSWNQMYDQAESKINKKKFVSNEPNASDLQAFLVLFQ